MPAHWGAEEEVFDRLQRPFPREWWYGQCGVPLELVVQHYNQRYGDDIDPACFLAMKDEIMGPALASVQAIPSVAEIVHACRTRLPMAVVSGGFRDHVLLTLQSIRFQDCFNPIITVDDGLRPKPAPDMFLRAAEQMGVEPRFCQVFEDGDAGLEGARRAGMIATDIRDWLRSSQAA